jgi:hypothetical protein
MKLKYDTDMKNARVFRTLFNSAQDNLFDEEARIIENTIRERFTADCECEIGFYDTYHGRFEYEEMLDGTFDEKARYVKTLKEQYLDFDGEALFPMPFAMKIYEQTDATLEAYNDQEADIDYAELELVYDGYTLHWWET